MGGCASIYAEVGDVYLELSDGSGKSFSNSDDISIGDIRANKIEVFNNGLTSDSDIVLFADDYLRATATNTAIVLSTVNGNFINNYDSNALVATNGRWLVYSSDPANTIENGLDYNKHYNSTYSLNPPASIPAGDYILYSLAPILTVIADDKNKLYGSAISPLTYSFTGFIDGDTIVTGTSGIPDLTTPTNTTSPTGIYPIIITQNTLNSPLGYQFTMQNGNYTVTPTPLIIVANDDSKTYGNANPAFSVAYNGFVLGQDQSVLGGTLDINTPAIISSNTGNYAITPSGYTSTNYDITFNDGTLTINPANLTITANDANKTYGDANPVFSVAYNGFVLGQDQSVLGGTLDINTPAIISSNTGM